MVRTPCALCKLIVYAFLCVQLAYAEQPDTKHKSNLLDPYFLGGGIGAAHSCAIAQGKNVYCWGNNGSSQLGTSSVSIPESTHALHTISHGGTLTSLALGNDYDCLLTLAGEVEC